MILKEQYRFKGIGKRLLVEGMRLLIKPNTENIYVTINENFKFVVQFFESFGFQQIAIVPDRYVKGEKELVYSCLKENWEDNNEN